MANNTVIDNASRLDSEIFKIHADFCSVLANEKRLRIMWMLQEGEYPVGAIAERLGISGAERPPSTSGCSRTSTRWPSARRGSRYSTA
ncbi:MAG: hypothetical protein AB2L13_04070 [Spirochaetota bacterium]